MFIVNNNSNQGSASVPPAPPAEFNPNLQMSFARPEAGEDILTVKVKLQRGAGGKSGTVSSLAGPYGICGNILSTSTGAYMLSLHVGGFAYEKGALKLQNGQTQPKGVTELTSLPARTFPEGMVSQVQVASPQAQALRTRLVQQDPADFLRKIEVQPGTAAADAIVEQLKAQHPAEANNIAAAYAELCGGNLSRRLVTPQDWDDVIAPLTGELYSRVWQEIPAELAEHIMDLADNVQDNDLGKPGPWNASLTLQFKLDDVILLEPKVKGTKRGGGDVIPYTLNGQAIQERSIQLPLLGFNVQSEVYKPVNPFRAVPRGYTKAVLAKAYANKPATTAGRDMSDVEERWAINQALLQEFGSIAGGKKKVQARLAQTVAKAKAGEDVTEEVAVIKALAADPSATHFTEARVEEQLIKPLEAIKQQEADGEAPVIEEEVGEVFVPTSNLASLMDALG
jgi:hypothetical protein